MKFIVTIFAFISFGTSSFCQILSTLSVDTFFQGELYPVTITIYGNNIFPLPITQKVYGIYFQNHLSPASSITLVDSLEFPQQSALTSRYQDSIRIQNPNFIPFDADTGMYDLILVKCNNSTPPNLFFYDTLQNAVLIQIPDAFIYGKTFLDMNYDKAYDSGDSAVSFFHIGLDWSQGENIRYDSSGNYFFPVRNGSHSIGWNNQTEYVINTDSSFYHLTINNNNIYNVDFGYIPGMTGCAPDTVHQLDTVNFDFFSNGIFLTTDYDYLVFIDSLGNETTEISVGLFSDSTTYIDSTHIINHMTITISPGLYSVRVKYYRSFLEYTLSPGVVVLPPISTSVNELANKSQFYLVPNPTNQYFQINSTLNDASIQYKIYNYFGCIILSGSTTTSQKISISQFGNGVYFAKIITSNGAEQLLRFVVTN